MSFRIMVRGEDGMLWCEANGKTREWCEKNGDSLCFEYANASWWIEDESPRITAPDGYDEDYGEEYYD